MRVTRRSLAKSLGAGLACRVAPALALGISTTEVSGASAPLPDKGQFITGEYETCLNNARWHPLSKGSREAIERYLAYKQRGVWAPPDEVSATQQQVKKGFAEMIHADTSDLAYVTSTTAGEAAFVAAMGPLDGGNIVTDALHFEGSLYLYDAMKRAGADVRVVKPREWGIPLEDMEKVIDKRTRLVAVSQVSFINGFEHDMKKLCELAHSRGALVYADAVQAAGSVPIDVRASGVDAMGSASYKWLMGDMGIGFLYVKPEVLGRLHRPLLGYRQLAQFSYHAFPWDKPGTFPVEWKQREDTAGYFELGTYDNAGLAGLGFSLPYLQRLGIDKVQQHAQTLLGRLRVELPRLGYACITPESSRGPINTFLVKDEKATATRLKEGKIDVSLSTGRMRISPSVYNDQADIERLLAALS